MAAIQVIDLSFQYPDSGEMIFSHVSFTLDTDWKLGFIGRNGKGKTTFLRILMGMEGATGRVVSPCAFDLFPFPVPDEGRPAREVARAHAGPYAELEARMEAALADPDGAQAYAEALGEYLELDGYALDARLLAETGKLGLDPAALDRPFATLSPGERAKVQLAALFLRKNAFLLIDEPTNHLDAEGRRLLQAYLAAKKGFILVSHDRALLDGACDHILSLNRQSIEVQQGNYSSWRFNRDARDQFELEENARLQGEIARLAQAGRQKADWADRVEASKIGSHAADRGFIGAKSAKMMKRAKHIEARREKAVEEKKALLHDLEREEPLHLHPLVYGKRRLVYAEKLAVDYGSGPLFAPVSFSLEQGERLALCGPNGSGKSSILRLLLGQDVPHAGELRVGAGVVVSRIEQDASALSGSLRDFALARGVDYTLLLATLRRLDFARAQFEKDLSAFSQGQKKKALLAASLCAQAHLFVWDEPLNYIDIFSRVQIENLLLEFQPTLVFVEHDAAFCDRIATQRVELRRP